MRKLIAGIIGLVCLVGSVFGGDHWVRPHIDRNGKFYSGHYQTDPNGTVRDNYGYFGNVNPHTGKVGNNRYRHSPSSEYYDGGPVANSAPQLKVPKGYDGGSMISTMPVIHPRPSVFDPYVKR